MQYELFSKIEFIPYKIKCSNITFDGESLSWESDNKANRIEENELDEFLRDSERVAVEYSYFYFHASIGNAVALDTKPLIDYMLKWGELYPVKEKRLNIYELMRNCVNSYYAVSLFKPGTAFLDSFLEVNKMNRECKFGKKVKFFILNPINIYEAPGKDFFGWLPPIGNKIYVWLPSMVRQKTHSQLMIQIPAMKDYNVSNDDEDIPFALNHLKQHTIKCIAEYISNQGLKTTAEYDPEQGRIKLSVKIRNNLLIQIIKNIPQFNISSIRYCGCGCEQILPSSRKNFIDNTHYENYRNKKPQRRIEKLISKWLERGQISPEQKEVLDQLADDMWEKGYSKYDEIRQVVIEHKAELIKESE